MTAVTKIQRTMDACLAVLREHEAAEYGLPTNPRFVAYELEQRGLAVKPDPADKRPNKRRSHGWPPGFQDVQDAILRLRERAPSRGSGSLIPTAAWRSSPTPDGR
jgi:hypothetical protein